MDDRSSLFVLGFGNPGRRDDGLGPWIAEELSRRCVARVEIDTAFQPGIEHCARIADCGAAVFIDAARKGPRPFAVTPLGAAASGGTPEATKGASRAGTRERAVDSADTAVARPGFTTHLWSPEVLLAVAEASFGARPPAWLVGVRGYRFGIGEGLSRKARRNAELTLEFLGALFRGREKEASMAGNEARTKTVLIVDDDPDVRATLRIILESAGFSVGEAADGDEGMKIAERIKPDAILLDLMMETVDAGSKVSTRLKEKGFACPIFLLSAVGDAVRYNIGTRELGLAGIFQKPVDPHTLLVTLQTKLKIS